MANKEKNTTGKIDSTGWWVLFATISASSMAFIGGSALNVALPAIQADLDASGGELLWIVQAFALFLAALLLLGGSLGDHYGRKRVYMIGILIFTSASIASGIAPNSELLILARIVQGIGGALMVPGSLAIVSAYFDDNTRGKAIGYWSSATILTSIAGPILGGVLAENGLWRWIFFLNIPLAIVALWALWTHVPESRDEEATPHFDTIGAILFALGMGGITYGAINIGEAGLDGLQRYDLIAILLAGVVLMGLFIFQESRSKEPMMPLSLFKSPTFLGTNLLTLFLYGALGGALYFFPLNLVQVQGYRESFAGFAMLPWSIILVILSPMMGGIVDRYGPRLPLVIGPLITGVGFASLTLIGITEGISDYWLTFLPATLLLGFGMGITVAPLTTAVMGSVPQHSAGIASGVNNAMSRASQVLALSIMGGIALVFFIGNLSPSVEALELPAEAEVQILDSASDLGGIPIPEALSETETDSVRTVIREEFVAMFNLMMWIATGLCWLSAVLALIFVEGELNPFETLHHPHRCHGHVTR